MQRDRSGRLLPVRVGQLEPGDLALQGLLGFSSRGASPDVWLHSRRICNRLQARAVPCGRAAAGAAAAATEGTQKACLDPSPQASPTSRRPVNLDQVLECDGCHLPHRSVHRVLHRHPQQVGQLPRRVVVLQQDRRYALTSCMSGNLDRKTCHNANLDQLESVTRRPAVAVGRQA